MASGVIFTSLMISLIVFNFCVASLSGNALVFLANMAISGIIGIIVAGAIVAILVGQTVIGFSSASVKIAFGMGVLLALLFQIPLSFAGYDFGIGLGLLTNVFTLFSISELYGIPFFLTALIGLVIIVSALQMMTGGQTE